MIPLRRLFRACLALVATVGCTLAIAHDLPTNTMMNAFVQVGAHEADLVVRVPMDLLRGVPFPQTGTHYDVANSGETAELAAQMLADGFVLQENGKRLAASRSAARLSAPSDRSFEAYDSALATAEAPPSTSTVMAYDTGYLDLHLVYPIGSPKSTFTIQTQVPVDVGVMASLTIRYLQPGEASRAMIIAGGAEPVDLDPTWYRAAGSFIALGVDHILTGTDHLLFLFCLVIPVRRLRGVISVITAFTLAHSVTLFASAFHLAPRGAWFPPLVEMAIAASIVYTALENVAGVNLKHRWQITALFGLVHGFGFSNALGESLQFAGSHLLLSLFSFNVGIEIGQLGVLAVMLPVLVLLRRCVRERIVIVVLSAVGACIGGQWLVERWQALQQISWPNATATAFAHAAPWVVALLLVAYVGWLVARWLPRRTLRGVPDSLERAP